MLAKYVISGPDKQLTFVYRTPTRLLNRHGKHNGLRSSGPLREEPAELKRSLNQLHFKRGHVGIQADNNAIVIVVPQKEK